MALIRSITTVLFIVSIPVILVTINVRIAFNEQQLWSYGFTRYRADLRANLDRSEIDRAASQLHDYFNDDTERFDIKVLQGGNLVPLFSEKEIQHLVDVKDLIHNVYRLQTAALAYALIYIVSVFVWARELAVRSLARRILLGSVATIAVVVSVGAVAVVGFDQLWRQFHEISFTNDLWALNPATDRLIQMFPQPFWQDATFFVGFLTIAQASLMASISLLYLRATQSTDHVGPDDGLYDDDPPPISEPVSV